MRFGAFTGVATTSYYLGSKLVAVKKGATLSYIHQDSLGSSSVTSNSSGVFESRISYLPFGDCRNSTGTLPTDQMFTGQRLDANTGLYYYNARYYDPQIGRFISADPVVSSAPIPFGDEIGPLTVSYAQFKWLERLNQQSGKSRNTLLYEPELSYQAFMPQEMNRYSYALNNPLRYVDPEGNQVEWVVVAGGAILLFCGYLVYYSYVNQPGNDYSDFNDVVDSARESTGKTLAGLWNQVKGWFSEATTGDPNQNPKQSKRDELLSKATNDDLKNAIDQLYRPGAKFGDGGTADYIKLFGDPNHVHKAMGFLKNLETIMKTGGLNETDYEIAAKLYQDLLEAILQNGILP